MNRISEDIATTLTEHPAADDNYIARKVLRSAGFSDAEVAYVADIVSNVVASQRRNHWRAEERAAFSDFVNSRPAPTPGQGKFSEDEGPDPFRALIEAGAVFTIRGKGIVTWGAATIADHAERIANLAAQRDGIDRTIAQHQAAINRIRSSGARCLAEVLTTAEAA